MARFEIVGGQKLSGKIKIAGNKNSVLPIMSACLLTEEVCFLENVPNISDVFIMAKLLEICGASVSGIGTSKLVIDCQKINQMSFPVVLTEKLRASVLLLGPMLVRTGKIEMGYPGGDIIGRRPLDAHVQVLKSFGAKIEEKNDQFLAQASKLYGSEIFLHEASVTATENAIMAASLAEGQTIVKRGPSEPLFSDLC